MAAIQLNNGITYPHTGYPALCIGLGLPPGHGLILTAPKNNPFHHPFTFPLFQGLTQSLLYSQFSCLHLYLGFLVWTKQGVRHVV